MAVIQPSAATSQRSLLLAMRGQYTSITDELETYCGLLSPQRTPPVSPPPGRLRNTVISNPQMAWQIENEHLRDAEESDYQQMEDLIQRRYNLGSDDENYGTAFYITTENQRRLRRASAIDEDSTRRHAPTINVTREIEQTLARPSAMRNSSDSDNKDKDLGNVAAPASETMC